jgi:hypothetical protein
MAERRYADYLRGDGDLPGDPPKPTTQGPQPSRAWLERADEDGEPTGVWGMTVEHQMRYATNHSGSLAELVGIAGQSVVTDYYVWSSEARDFVLCSEDTVMEHEV